MLSERDEMSLSSRVTPRDSLGISDTMELQARSLSQARWSEHRKKIGLSHASFNSYLQEVSPQDVSQIMNLVLAVFIQIHILLLM